MPNPTRALTRRPSVGEPMPTRRVLNRTLLHRQFLLKFVAPDGPGRVEFH